MNFEINNFIFLNLINKVIEKVLKTKLELESDVSVSDVKIVEQENYIFAGLTLKIKIPSKDLVKCIRRML